MGSLQLTYQPKLKTIHSHEAKSVQLWLSTDPLAEKFPNASPYNYCLNNPLIFVDPDGKAPTDWYRNKITGKITWKDGQKERWGYERLGHSLGYTDKNGNRALLNGDTKQISYNGKVLADFSQNPKAEYGGFAFADGGNNQNPSELDRGGRNAQWIDASGVIDLMTTIADKIIGGVKDLIPKGIGTTGGSNTIEATIKTKIDAVDKASNLVKGTITPTADTIYSVTRKIDSQNNNINIVIGSRKADSIIKAYPHSKKKVEQIIRSSN
ncbi:hypothetical protein BWK59_14910 [Flavobacterium davisii]|uniref:RHS repeat-associated core domain-containing protein n=1 Tax=Flavobacterium davisii TaxID=2906077 RepID=A0A246GET8_9FLAO|nr:hypothetical protein BWK59_14910 [Flavobacterium davisii]